LFDEMPGDGPANDPQGLGSHPHPLAQQASPGGT
jgi:hypothetical protein